MRAVAVDVGNYKSVLSSPENGGDTVENSSGSRSTRSIVDTRGKKRLFGLENGSCKERRLVHENLRDEAGKIINGLQAGSLQEDGDPKSELLGFLNHIISHYFSVTHRGSDLEVGYTVPYYHRELHREYTRRLIESLGFRGIPVPETTALAVCYLFKKSVDRSTRVLMVDCGHSKITVSPCVVGKERIQVLGREGIPMGGELIGRRLGEIVFAKSRSSAGGSDSFGYDEFVCRNEKSLTKMKHALSGVDSVSGQFDVSYEKSVGVVVERSEVEVCIEEIVKCLGEMVSKGTEILREAGAESGEEIVVEMTGGSSRVPLLRKAVQDAAGVVPQSKLNPEEACALGALFYTALKTGGYKFPFKPVIEDYVDEEFVVEISTPQAEGIPKVKSVSLFKRGDVCPSGKKVVKIPRPKDSSARVLLRSGGDIVLEIIPRPKEKEKEEEKEEEREEEKKEEQGDENGRENNSTEEGKEGNEPEGPKDNKLVLTVSLTAGGSALVQSDEVDTRAAIDMINFRELSTAELKRCGRERMLTRIEDDLDAIQSRLYSIYDSVSDGYLSKMENREAVLEMLAEKTDQVPAGCTDISEVQAWRISAEDELDQIIRPGWEKILDGICKEKEERVALQWPGSFAMYNPFDEIISARKKIRMQREKEEREREERERREREEKEKNVQRDLEKGMLPEEQAGPAGG
jgi:Hsp70 protein